MSGKEQLRTTPACAPATGRPTLHILMFALGANAVPRDIGSCGEAGFFYCPNKPIKVNQLMEALEVALNYSHAARDRAAKKEQVCDLPSPTFSIPAS